MEINGVITQGDTGLQTYATLPTEYRPTTRLIVGGIAVDRDSCRVIAPISVFIDTDGTVNVSTPQDQFLCFEAIWN